MQCEGMGHDSMCNSFHCDFFFKTVHKKCGVGVADDLQGAIGAVYGLCNICFNNFFVDVSSIIN